MISERAMKAKILQLGIVLIAAIAAPLLAHHSISAEFDSTKPITLSGTVTNVDWMNPHTYVFVDVNDPSLGKTRTWACELASPNESRQPRFHSVVTEGWDVGPRDRDTSQRWQFQDSHRYVDRRQLCPLQQVSEVRVSESGSRSRQSHRLNPTRKSL